MIKFTVFLFSSLCVALGWSFKDRGPMPMEITTDGTLLYPMSSGSNDIAILSLGLILFAGAAAYAPISALFNHRTQRLLHLYLVTWSLFVLIALLVSLDSSLLFAASVGDVMPLVSTIAATIPLPVIVKYLVGNSNDCSDC